MPVAQVMPAFVRAEQVLIVEGGDARAARILGFQDQPGLFFTTVQIGLNAVAILAGIVGDSLLSPAIRDLLPDILGPTLKGQVASAVPFVGVTLFFVLFADLIPKRIAMAVPETVALRSIEGMRRVIFVLAPLSRVFNSLSSIIYRALGLPNCRACASPRDPRRPSRARIVQNNGTQISVA